MTTTIKTRNSDELKNSERYLVAGLGGANRQTDPRLARDEA
jgi:hypothetical protein